MAIEAVGTDDGYKWLAGSVVVVGALMSILDQTVVSVALPTLQRDFNVSLTNVQWVITAYTLALASVIPMSGWLSDRFGAKWVFIASQLVFIVASALCGLSWSHATLIVFRILQGVGGGLILPAGMTIVMRASRPDERGRMMAVLGIPMLIAPVLGPTLGGWLVQSVSWRLIFFINVPIGMAGCVFATLKLRDDRVEARAEHLDLLGLLLASPAVFGMVYGLSQPSTYGWLSAQTLLPLVAGCLMLGGFVLHELRQEHPLIDVRIFRDAAFSAAMTLSFLVSVALFAGVLLTPLFLQQVQGRDPLNAGMIMAVQGLSAAAVMPLAGVLTDRVGGAWVVPIGIALVTSATIWMATLSWDTPVAQICLMLALRGGGMGFTMMPAMSAAYVTVMPDRVAQATSVANVVQRVAGSLGVAIMATILTNRIVANLPPLPAGVSATSGAGISGAPLPAPVRDFLLTQVAKGFDATFWVSAGMVVLAFPAGVLLRRAWRPREVRDHAVREAVAGLALASVALAHLRWQPSPSGGPPQPALNLRPVLRAAADRLSIALQLLREGTAASGLIPQPRLSTARRLVAACLLVAAVAVAVVSVLHGYATPVVPPLPTGIRPSG